MSARAAISPAPSFVRVTRNRQISLVHVAKKELGLDDETYRAMLSQVTGKASAADCTEAELVRVVEHMRSKGFQKPFKGSSRAGAFRLSGKYLPKVRALWISAYNLGVVRDRRDGAMESFIKRQTGLDSARWLTDAGDASRVIEALKSWMTREAGVQWTPDVSEKVSVVRAQFRRLAAMGVFKVPAAQRLDDAIALYAHVTLLLPSTLSRYSLQQMDQLIVATGHWLREAQAKKPVAKGV